MLKGWKTFSEETQRREKNVLNELLRKVWTFVLHLHVFDFFPSQNSHFFSSLSFFLCLYYWAAPPSFVLGEAHMIVVLLSLSFVIHPVYITLWFSLLTKGKKKKNPVAWRWWKCSKQIIEPPTGKSAVFPIASLQSLLEHCGSWSRSCWVAGSMYSIQSSQCPLNLNRVWHAPGAISQIAACRVL